MVVQGTLNSTATTTFRLEFFSNAACDASGNGEGRTFIGAASVPPTRPAMLINVPFRQWRRVKRSPVR